MLTAKDKQESISKVRAWLGITDTEHKISEADEDKPLDMTEMAKSLYDVQPPEITEMPKEFTETLEGGKKLKHPITLSEARKQFRQNAKLPKMILYDTSVDIFQ